MSINKLNLDNIQEILGSIICFVVNKKNYKRKKKHWECMPVFIFIRVKIKMCKIDFDMFDFSKVKLALP
jgi:hypothetical protein